MSVRRTLLGLLEPAPAHGYVLKRRYDELFTGRRPLRFGQVYSTLARLERDGLAEVVGVEAGAGPERRQYAITPDGVSDLDSWLRAAEPPDGSAPDPVMVKTVLALLSGRPAAEVLDAQRGVHLARMRELTRERSGAASHDLLALTFELAHLDADLRWIEETAQRLERGELTLAPEWER